MVFPKLVSLHYRPHLLPRLDFQKLQEDYTLSSFRQLQSLALNILSFPFYIFINVITLHKFSDDS